MSNATILCVDDDRNVLQTLRTQLIRYFPDYSVEMAESGAEAFLLVEEILADGGEVPLVIVDQIMPEIKGDEFLVDLHARYPHILQVMLTGQATAEDIGNVVNRGNLYRFMAKPWSEFDLQLTIAEALRCYHQEQQLHRQQVALEWAYRELEALNADLEQQVQERTHQLQQNEQQLRLFIEHTPAAVAMFDREMRYILASRRWKVDYCLGDEDLIGRSHYEVFPEIPDRWKVIYQRCLAGVVEQCDEDCFVRQDGSITWNSWEIHPWYTDTQEIGGIIIFTQVITEQKQTELALRESEERFREIAQTVSQLFFVRSAITGEFNYISPAYESIWGRNCESLYRDQHSWLEAVYPDDRALVEQSLAEQLAGNSVQREYRIVRPNGDIRWISAQISLVQDALGNPLRFIGTAVDMTDRKLAEISLRESEQRHATLAEASPVGIFRINPSGALIYTNDRWCEITGLNQAEAFREGWLKAIHPDWRDRLPQNWQQVDANGTSSFETCLVHPDGSIYWVYCQVLPEYNEAGELIGSVGTLTDITQLKQAEASLLEAQRLAHIGSWSFDLGTQEITWSEELYYMFGLDPAQPVPPYAEYLEKIHPEDRPRLLQYVEQATLHGAAYILDYRAIHADGSIRYHEGRGEAIQNAQGQVVKLHGTALDITDRKQAEAKIQQSEELLQATLEFSGIGTWSWQPSTGEYAWNGQVEQLLEIPPDLGNMFQIWHDRIHPDDVDRVNACIQNALEAGTTFADEYRYQLLDGSMVWRWVKGQGVYNQSGDLERVLGVVQDITDRKLAELRLQQTTEELDRFFSVALDLLCIANTDGYFLRLNPAWEKTLGYSLDALRQQKFLDFVHPDDLNSTLEAITALSQHQEILNFVNRYRHRDGSYRWIEWRSIPVGQLIYSAARDITERKQAEMALQESKRFLSMALSAAKAGVWEWNLVTNSSYWSNENFRLMGYEPGSIEASYKSWLRNIHPDDRQKVETDIAQVIAGRNALNMEYRVLLPGGTVRWLSGIGQILRDDRGNSIGMTGLQIDITDRKWVEVQLEAQNVLLEKIAKGDPLTDILQAFIDQIEQQLPGSHCSIMFVNEDKLQSGPAQHLPKPYMHAVDGVLIAEGAGSCGTAAFRNQPIIVSDIANDVLWADYKDLALSYGLKACWSVPIVANDDQVLGTFAVYYLEVRLPQPYELETISQMANIAGIAIERDQAEATLRESERRYATLTEVAPVGIFRLDLAGDCVYVNHHWSEMTGRPAEAALGQGWIDAIHPEDRELLTTGWLEAKVRGGVHQSEGRHFHPDGTTTWFYAQILPETDSDGAVTGYVGALTDITDRKQIEDSLRQSEAKQSALISALPDLIMRVSRDGIYLDFFSTSNFKVLGNQHSIVGTHVADTLPSELAQRRIEAIHAALETGKLQIYEQEIWVDESLQTEECRVVVCSENEVLIIGRDITDRKRAEAALKQSEERRRLALDLTETGSWEFELATGEAIWSDSQYRLMGLTPLEYLNHYQTWNDRVHPGDRAWVEQAFTYALETQSLLNVEYRVIHPDGQTRWVLTKGQGIYDENGQPLRMLGVMIDVSDRKYAELALQQLNEELEKRVQQRTQDLQQINAQLRDSEARFQTFMNNSPTAAWISDINGVMVYANQTYYRTFQVPTQDVTHRSLFELYSADVAQNFLANTQYAAATEQVLEKLEICPRPDGTDGDFLVYKFPVSDSSDQRLVGGIAIDITERRQAEEAIRFSQEQLQLALEGSGDGLWDWNISTGETYFSPRWLGILGYEIDELPGHIESWKQLIHPTDRAELMATLEAHLKDSAIPYQVEYRARAKTGAWHWIASYGKVVARDADENPLRMVGLQRDITDRKQAQENLQAEQLRLQLALEAAKMATWSCSLQTGQLIWSDRAQEIFGFVPGTFPGDRETFLSMVYAEDVDRVTQAIAHTFETGTPYSVEYRIRRLDGGLRWIAVWGIVPQDQPDADRQIIGVVCDITNRKQADAALRDSEERLRLALTATNQGLYDLNLKTGEAIVSSEYATMLGYDPATFQETNAKWIERLHPDDTAAVAETYRAYTAGEIANYQVEFRQRTQSGQWKWVLSLGRIVAWDETGAPLRMLGTHTDLDDRKRAEAQLQEQEQFLRSIFENVENPIFVIDVLDDDDFRIMGWNPASERISHIPIANVIGKPVIEAMGTEVGSEMCNNYRRCIEQGSPLTYEEFLSLPSGKIWTLTTLNPVKDLDGKVYRIVGTALNITDRKQAEETLQRFNQELEQRVAHRTIELQQAMEAAETANRAKSSFLANMSHELRTPLNAILGFSQLLNRDTDLNGEQQERVGVINRSGEHLLNLINDILAMSKIEAGRITLTMKSFSLHSLLEDLAELFGLKAESKGLKLTTQIDPTVPQHIHTDESKLRQVLINLLSNAIKFTSEGEVILRVQSRGPESLMEASPLPLALYFEVEDTGCGIDPTERTLVFEPFGQTQFGQKIQEGTGLGLPISRQFVQLMGGELNFASLPGVGSTFYFTIPADRVQASDIPPPFSLQRVIGLIEGSPAYRLLVVEDNPENCQFLVQLLRSVGFEVKAATNGLEAVNLWQSWSPHFIWMDMRMPVMDGYTATQRIRTLEQGLVSSLQPHTPTKILALTASAFEDERSAILAAGCDDFVFKPATETMLFEKIAEHLGVRYRYQAQTDVQVLKPAALSEELLAVDLVQIMSRDWIQQLQRAARIADEDLMLELIEQIPADHDKLANGLRELVNELQLDKLIELTSDFEQ